MPTCQIISEGSSLVSCYYYYYGNRYSYTRYRWHCLNKWFRFHHWHQYDSVDNKYWSKLELCFRIPKKIRKETQQLFGRIFCLSELWKSQAHLKILSFACLTFPKSEFQNLLFPYHAYISDFIPAVRFLSEIKAKNLDFVKETRRCTWSRAEPGFEMLKSDYLSPFMSTCHAERCGVFVRKQMENILKKCG